MSNSEVQYARDKRCPKDNKRSVYYYFDGETIIYYCKYCGHTWRG
jgi:DNA-directed RNA polymerase subunit M/transcription elongation factor TFIIS